MTTPHSSSSVGAGIGASIGALASKYEGQGNAGTIANNSGDIGGASYGTYQIATKTGTMNSFLGYIKNAYPDMYKDLVQNKPGTNGFNATWKSLAKNNGQKFEEAQADFVKQSHYEPARASLIKSTGVDFSKRSSALQNVLFSTATQHGSGGAAKLIKRAGITVGMSDAEIIKRIYQERGADNGMRYFPSSSPTVRKSVVNRFKEEASDALSMLGGK